MTPENTRRLFVAFPDLYRGKDKLLTESLMSFGFACGDGWFDLIWRLSARLEEIARGEGRVPASDEWPEALQVKEKLGSLRVYIRGGSAAMQQAITETSELSEKTCEHCGALNARPTGGRTLCARHA